MPLPTFDIFSGSPDRDAMWIEVVSGLGAANDRLKQLAAKKPGPYFLFDPRQHAILARLDTSITQTEKSRRRGA